MDDGLKWAALGFLVVLMVIVLSSALQEWQQTKAVREMVKAGANPIAARCAVYGAQGYKDLCREALRADTTRARR